MTPDIPFLLNPSRAELADLYQPAAPTAEPAAAIVFIHGGGCAHPARAPRALPDNPQTRLHSRAHLCPRPAVFAQV